MKQFFFNILSWHQTENLIIDDLRIAKDSNDIILRIINKLFAFRSCQRVFVSERASVSVKLATAVRWTCICVWDSMLMLWFSTICSVRPVHALLLCTQTIVATGWPFLLFQFSFFFLQFARRNVKLAINYFLSVKVCHVSAV